MIKVTTLKALLEKLPDDAGLIAYEGEGIGLRVVYGDQFGWIETGSEDDVEQDKAGSDLSAFEASDARLR